ncbi:hypothetical protein [Geminicoccus flavidas]|uniref:hypothetical protein n=1 Tax=Geminicoccus flavidas TaxID=2506407 RepID=UPI00135C718C|nr:hypothetical protein [Geminicoccus flavidas]
MRPILLHLHVPRASGSSLYAWFRRAVGPSGVVQANAAAAVQQAVAGRRSETEPAVVSGHFLHGVHAGFPGQPYRYTVLLREPVRRVLSLFRYIRSLPHHDLHPVLNQPGMTIERFYRERLPGTGPRNAMVAQLSGILGTGVTPAEPHLEQALLNLLGEGTMFGVAEDAGPLLQEVAGFLGIDHPPEFPAVNRLDAKEAWGGSDADLAAITAANQLDIALYARAKATLAGRAAR